MHTSKLLKFLFAPFFMFADDAAGGGGAAAAEPDRGDTLADGGVVIDDAAEAAAKADADAEVARIEAEKAAADEAAKGEGEGEGEGTGEDGKPKKDTRIPLNRHKELLEKERAARAAVEAELAKYQQGAQIAKVNETIDQTETKLVSMETTYTKLLADGELEKATAMMRDIRQLERTIGEQKNAMNVAAAEARAVERVRFDTVVERLEAAYPVLNPNDIDNYDPEQVRDVLDLKEVYEKRGATPSAALQQAVAKLFPAATSKQETATTVTPNASKEDVAAARKAAATAAGIAAAKGTPAATAQVGVDSDKLGGTLTAENAMKLSQADFAKLDEATLARIRGDQL